jgi:hypothetical protein
MKTEAGGVSDYRAVAIYHTAPMSAKSIAPASRAQRAVGMENSVPPAALAGQRCMTDFCRV